MCHRLLGFARVGFLMLISIIYQNAYGQIGDSTCLYISLNGISSIKSYELNNGILCFSYQDKYAQSPNLEISIFDWKNQVAVQMPLAKQAGNNLYSLNLESIYGNWENNSIYRLETQNEMGRKMGFNFKLVDPPEKWKPVPDIVVNGIDIQCDPHINSEVEYYGRVTGGKAPYKVTWYVFRDPAIVDYLYQPKTVKLEQEGDVPMILVQESLDYYVLLHAVDACGSEKDKLVHIVCDEQEEGRFNLLYEPINLDNIIGGYPVEIGATN
jgi:hypothetical protein